MIAFHGSRHRGLGYLLPHNKQNATIDKPCVYLTTQNSLAALYVWDKPFYWFTYGFADNGALLYEEYYPNQLEDLYNGVSGSVYTVEGDFIDAQKSGFAHLFISESRVPIKSEQEVANAYSHILALEELGEIKIVRHNELSASRLEMIKNQMHQQRIEAKGEYLRFLERHL